MRLLLLNNNPAVSRLIKLSAEKAGHELDEFDDYGLVPLSSYDVILVDNESYDEASLLELKENIGCDYCLYICQRGAQKPESVNVSLEKPFLPTDFLTLLEKVNQVLMSQKEDVREDDFGLDDFEEENKHFDIDQIDALDTQTSFEEDSSEMLADNGASERFEFDNIHFEDELLDEAMAMDEALEKGLEREDEKSELEDFDFTSDENDTQSLEETPSLEEIAPCVLDKDDIDEVKQLLNESEDEEDDTSLNFLEESMLENVKEPFEEVAESSELLLEETPSLEELSEESLAWSEPEALEEEEAPSEEALFLETPALVLEEEDVEAQEENVVVDDAMLEEAFDTFAPQEEEEHFEEEDALVFAKSDEKMGIDSLDDLSESLIKKAFGEEVLEEEKSIPSLVNHSKEEEIEVIRGEIEKSISRSISSFTQSDILREALKGMRINISISFDENEAK